VGAVLTVGVLAALSPALHPQPVSAASGVDDYPSRLKNAPQDSLVDPWQFYNRECTSFVAWRLNHDAGIAFHNMYKGHHWGDASISHPFFSLFETFRFLIEMNHLDPGDPWFGRLRDAYLEPWGPGHAETFELAQRIAGLARSIAWLDQREALQPKDRPEFNEGFAGMLRLGLRAA